MSLNLALLLRESAKVHADKPAMVVGTTTLSYGQLHGYTQRFAGGLAKLGLKPGQHVALMLPNVPQFTIAYFGAHYNANPVVPLNVLLTADEIQYHLNDSDAVALVVWEGFAEQARAAFARSESCKHLIIAKADPTDVAADEGTINMTALIGSSEPVTELPATNPDDTAVILYTSGTTGRPKGAELTHFNMFFNAHYARKDLMRIDHETVALATLPLFHSFGQTCIQNAVLGAGGKVVLLPRFDPKTAFELMHHHKVSYFAGVPTMYFALLHYPEASQYELGLKICVSGGSAMPVEVMSAFGEKFTASTSWKGTGCRRRQSGGELQSSSIKPKTRLGRPADLGRRRFGVVDPDGNGRRRHQTNWARSVIQGPQHHEGLLQASPEANGRSASTTVGSRLGRHRLPGTRTAIYYIVDRSQGHDHPRWLQRVSARDRGGADDGHPAVGLKLRCIGDPSTTATARRSRP
jgi:acyl-CoA synthetase (AMP-forming)/AMP-acid ligase II